MSYLLILLKIKSYKYCHSVARWKYLFQLKVAFSILCKKQLKTRQLKPETGGAIFQGREPH
jgi:hypothetical protein